MKEDASPRTEPCVMVVFGASGDLTRRLLVPALYNLSCDGLLSDDFALLGVGRSDMDDARFRARMADREKGLPAFHTRNAWDEGKAFLHCRYTMTKDGTVVSSGLQVIGKDPAGGLRSWQFDKSGTFKYFCSVHPRMTGTVTVQ